MQTYAEFKKTAQTVTDVWTPGMMTPQEAADYHKSVQEANKISDAYTYTVPDDSDFDDGGPTYFDLKRQEMEDARAARFGEEHRFAEDASDILSDDGPGEFGEDLGAPAEPPSVPKTPMPPKPPTVQTKTTPTVFVATNTGADLNKMYQNATNPVNPTGRRNVAGSTTYKPAPSSFKQPTQADVTPKTPMKKLQSYQEFRTKNGLYTKINA